MITIIKGFTPPENCCICEFESHNWCLLTNPRKDAEDWFPTRPDYCPLVEMPEYEELLKAARAMHEWIFLNSGDEQAVYDECGLTDEMNTILGYAGKTEIPIADGEQ